jgi:hypothetical protein
MANKKFRMVTDIDLKDIRKTMCHHTLKGVVCDRHLFFG